MRSPSEMFIVRHGDTAYTNKGLDLTDKGIAQVAETARSLRGDLQKHDRLVALSSPTVRALGTAEVFWNELGLNRELVAVRKVGKLACFDVTDTPKFLAYMKERGTGIYGECWLKDPTFDTPNNGLVKETRSSVEERANTFLHRYGTAIARIGEENDTSIGAVATTHFEIGTVALGLALSDEPDFPIHEHAVLAHAEVVKVGLAEARDGVFEFSARGQSRKTQFDAETGRFVRV